MQHHTNKRLVYLGDASSHATIILLSELAVLGWCVDLISACRPIPGAVLPPEIKFHRLPVSAGYPLTYAAFLFAAPLILSLKPSVIHACGLSSYGIMAAVHRRFLRFKPMVLTISGADILEDAQRGMIRWSAEHALKMFEAVIAPQDDALLEELVRMAAPKDRLIYMDTGDPETIKTTAKQLERIYTKLLGGSEKPNKINLNHTIA
ncbi:MAG: glycosyltransferase [Dehalogenimonas sp.]